ncbi:hypothetical protein GCM10007301_18990 [Azorhizobium oxalatiphilum]|uniref:Uncharacterized protein n=1 Tax=Azorhizobium oxalatiphilum TaxID=980631 RepID=A0A917FBB6_9HYPH|nr:hypothetical protein [Azorhizobium oxalatiphilum]GGF59441.1 hypothetical protein GCM10007301_18990 [Azorhizobium oxalatiphilum]
MAKVWSFMGVSARRGIGLCVLSASALLAPLPVALAQSSGPVPHIEIHPRKPDVIELPVIPQGNYLNPGPGAPIRPDVPLGDDRNENYVFPQDIDVLDGGSPPGDPTSGGGFSPLPADTPSF